MHVVWQTDWPGRQLLGSSHSAKSYWRHGVFVVSVPVETVDVVVVREVVEAVVVEVTVMVVGVVEDNDVSVPVDRVEVSVVLLTQTVMLHVVSHSCACWPVLLKMVVHRSNGVPVSGHLTRS
jgi:hypothetical protein